MFITLTKKYSYGMLLPEYNNSQLEWLYVNDKMTEDDINYNSLTVSTILGQEFIYI